MSSSSWVELCGWHQTHALGDFPWREWVQDLAEHLPLPIYDLPRILHVTEAYDMAMHAVHWQGGSELRPVNVPHGLAHMMRGIGLALARQRVYMARALYAHCSRYVTGVPRICDPPRGHLGDLPVIPLPHLQKLAAATLTPAPAHNLSHWLERVLQHGIMQPLHVRSKFKSGRASRRRGRKHSPQQQNRAVADLAQYLTDTALADIMALAPAHVPRLWCHIVAVGGGTLTLALSAQPLALCDE